MSVSSSTRSFTAGLVLLVAAIMGAGALAAGALRAAGAGGPDAVWELGLSDLLALAAFAGGAWLFTWKRPGRMRAEGERRAAEVRSHGLADALEETPTAIRNMDGTIRHWTKGMSQLYGWSVAQAVGRVSHELLDTRFPLPLDRINAALRENGRWAGQLSHRRADGARIVVMSVWLLERGRAGERVIEVNTDVTELRTAQDELRALHGQLEQRIEERTAELREANRQLDGFAYTISHDLRAPLRAMEGYAEALIEDAGDLLTGELREFADRIVAAARRMDGLIEDVLTYSRLSRADLRPQALRLSRLLDGVLRDLRPQIAETRAVIEVDEGLPPVLADPTALKLALTNLLTNAIKFVTPGLSPQVRIRAERVCRDGAAPWVRIVVEDNGIGVAPEHHERIFQPFQRLHGADHYPGTGVGLGIVKRAMERSGGRYGVDSQPGRGSRFWIELPSAESVAVAPSADTLEDRHE